MNTDPKDLVRKALKIAIDSNRNRMKMWEQYYLAYRQTYPHDREDDHANMLYHPVTFDTVETVRCKIPTALSTPPITILPQGHDDEEKASILTEWMHWLYRVQRMKTKVRKLAWYASLFGTGVLYLKWHRRYDDPKYPGKDVSSNGLSNVLYDAPQAEVVDIRSDWYADPTGEDIDSCRWVIHRQVVHKDDLEHLEWVENKADLERLGDLYRRDSEDHRRVTQDVYKDPEVENLHKADLVEILYYWEDRRLIMLANREHVLRDGPNPYRFIGKPFVLFRDVVPQGELYGIGEAEVVRFQQIESNTLVRALMDMIVQKALPPLVVRRGTSAEQEIDKLDPRKNMGRRQVLITEDPSFDLREFQYGPLPPGAFQLLDQLRLQSQQASGMTDLVKGQTPRGYNDTATGAQILYEGGMDRVADKVENFSEGLLNWMRICLGLARQFWDVEQTIRIIGNDGGQARLPITNDIFQLGWDLFPESTDTRPISIQNRQAKGQMLINLIATNPLVDPRAALTDGMKQLGYDRPDRYLKSPEQLRQEQEATQQQAAMQLEQQQALREMASRQHIEDQLAIEEGRRLIGGDDRQGVQL